MTRKSYYERWSDPLVAWWHDLSDTARRTLRPLHNASHLVVRDLRTGETYGGTIDVWPVAEEQKARDEREDEVLDLEDAFAEEEPAADHDEARERARFNKWLRDFMRGELEGREQGCIRRQR